MQIPPEATENVSFDGYYQLGEGIRSSLPADAVASRHTTFVIADSNKFIQNFNRHNLWVRLNAVVFFGLTVLLCLSGLAWLSKIGHSLSPANKPGGSLGSM